MPELCRFYDIVDELYRAWNNAVRNMPVGEIDPLQ